MRRVDAACMAKGFVSPSFVDIKTGKRMPFKTRHNLLSYMSAEAMAAAFGGDPSYIPAKMGFIYGEDGSFIGDITRTQRWDLLLEELSEKNADVQVVGFSYPPSLGGESGSGSSSSSSSSSSDPDGGDYNTLLPTGSNAITFHAVSNSQDSGARETAAFKTNDYVYQAVLLGSHQGDLYILSRVSLDDGGSYRQKPSGFEVALDWTVVFH